jgi:hypothetical protein
MNAQKKYQRLGIPRGHDLDLEIGYAFGVALVRCPECGIIWTSQFAPEICIECGTRIMEVWSRNS